MSSLDIDPSFGHWFAGFTDGEGCFLIQKKRNGYVCRFSITLRADDRKTLEHIQQELEVGSIYDIQPKNLRNPNPTCLFQTYSKGAALVVRDLFLIYPLRAKKVHDFQSWSQAVDAWLDLDWIAMADAKKQLEANRKYRETYV